ncbi:MAG: hypothetical protein AB7D36_07730 [Oscillospiraceae bacterium]
MKNRLLKILRTLLVFVYMIVLLGTAPGQAAQMTTDTAESTVQPDGETPALAAIVSEATLNTVAWTVISTKYENPVTISESDAELIAKTIYGEAGACSEIEQAAVAWCILNRVDSTNNGMGDSVEEVVTSPDQFLGYSEDNPVEPELLALAKDVLERHALEARGKTDVGRVLPTTYLWFSGDLSHNYFRDSYSGGDTWDWSLPDPYTED